MKMVIHLLFHINVPTVLSDVSYSLCYFILRESWLPTHAYA